MDIKPLKLYATGEKVNGHESLQVSPGSEAEAHWRSLGYVPAEELTKKAAARLEVEPEAVEPQAAIEQPEPEAEAAAEAAPEAVEPAPAPKKRRGRPRKDAK